MLPLKATCCELRGKSCENAAIFHTTLSRFYRARGGGGVREGGGSSKPDNSDLCVLEKKRTADSNTDVHLATVCWLGLADEDLTPIP